MNLSREILIALYHDLLRIRKIELRIESLYHLDEMKTPIHLCIGQEAVAVGVCANLNKDDYVCSNHRGHGHYLAKGGDLKSMIAELYCRETGCSKGRGGSMHLVDISVRLMGSSSIVGGGIPVATGLALAIRMRHQPKVSVVFFGDGAVDEGVFYESVNFAILKRLPVIFVYENNHFSVCSRVSARQWGEILFHTAPKEKLLSYKVDGNDILAIYRATQSSVSRARAGLGPSFIECDSYRMRGHAGAGSDAGFGYRTTEEIAEWEKRCPVTTFRHNLLSRRLITKGELDDMEKAIDAEINVAFSFAQKSPLPPGGDLPLYLFNEEHKEYAVV